MSCRRVQPQPLSAQGLKTWDITSLRPNSRIASRAFQTQRVHRKPSKDIDPSSVARLLHPKQMSDGLTADLLFAYVGIITTATVSIYAGSFGSLPVSPPSVTRRRCSIRRAPLAMMPTRSQRVVVAQSARMTTRTTTRTRMRTIRSVD